MTRPALGRTARWPIAKDRVHGPVFSRVVEARTSAVKVDVIDLFRLQASMAQRARHGEPRTEALRMWRRHVVRIVAAPIAQQSDIAAAGARRALDQHQSC